MSTEYRLVNDGYCERLQYKVRDGWWFIKPKWAYVPRPYYHNVWGRTLDPLLHDTVICSYNTNSMKKFIEKWSNIQDYLQYYTVEQQKLVDEATLYWQKHNEKKGVKYL